MGEGKNGGETEKAEWPVTSAANTFSKGLCGGLGCKLNIP